VTSEGPLTDALPTDSAGPTSSSASAEQEKAGSCEERQVNDGKPPLKGLATDVAYGSEARIRQIGKLPFGAFYAERQVCVELLTNALCSTNVGKCRLGCAAFLSGSRRSAVRNVERPKVSSWPVTLNMRLLADSNPSYMLCSCCLTASPMPCEPPHLPI